MIAAPTGAVVAAIVLLAVAARPRATRQLDPGEPDPSGPKRERVIVGRTAATTIDATIRRAVAAGSRRRRQRAVEQAWPDAIELLVHGLEAGLTPRHAVDHLMTHAPMPVRPGFVAVVARVERGRPFADALRALPEVLGPPAAGAADVIATSERYGLPLAPVLDQLAREARDARRRLDQAAARKLPIRLSFPLVTCTLPSFVLLAIAPAVIAALSSLGSSAW